MANISEMGCRSSFATETTDQVSVSTTTTNIIDARIELGFPDGPAKIAYRGFIRYYGTEIVNVILLGRIATSEYGLSPH